MGNALAFAFSVQGKQRMLPVSFALLAFVIRVHRAFAPLRLFLTPRNSVFQ
jgi:hypothetical protein